MVNSKLANLFVSTVDPALKFVQIHVDDSDSKKQH